MIQKRSKKISCPLMVGEEAMRPFIKIYCKMIIEGYTRYKGSREEVRIFKIWIITVQQQQQKRWRCYWKYIGLYLIFQKIFHYLFCTEFCFICWCYQTHMVSPPEEQDCFRNQACCLYFLHNESLLVSMQGVLSSPLLFTFFHMAKSMAADRPQVWHFTALVIAETTAFFFFLSTLGTKIIWKDFISLTLVRCLLLDHSPQAREWDQVLLTWQLL